jgi:hypothetical protein
LVEVVGSRRGTAVAPEHLHRLLAVELVARRESEQLHKLARLLQPPGALRDDHAVDRCLESAEQPETDIAHPGDSLDQRRSVGRWSGPRFVSAA